MQIWINGSTHELDGMVSVADALAAAGLPERGVAVAVDGEVLPRARWDRTLTDGARLEVLTAVQGG